MLVARSEAQSPLAGVLDLAPEAASDHAGHGVPDDLPVNEIRVSYEAQAVDPRWAVWLEQFDSLGTQDGYGRDASQWARWLESRGRELHAATEQDITTWMARLRDRGLAVSTVNRKVAAACSYYRWAAKAGLVPVAIAPEKRPKVHVDPVRRLGKPLAEVKALIRAAEPGLEKALVTLLAHTGVRVSEATGANVTSIRIIQGQRVLQVLGKGRKPRTPPLTDEAYAPLAVYLAGRRSGPLFLTASATAKQADDEHRLDRFEAWRIVRRVGRRAGLEMHPHLFRHSAAVLMARKYQIKQIAVFLGHADIKTTALYLEGLAALEESPAYDLSRQLAEDET